VISVLKTSGIADRVNHRRVILPQLAAAGIEAKIISTRTGWTVIWGPVYARDIPSFLKNKRIKRPSMRDVRFHFVQRMEMAAAWAFSVSVVSSAVLFFVWREAVFPVAGFIWVLAVTVFALFPIYSVLQRSRLGRIGIFIVFLGACLGGLVLVSFLGGDTTWKFYLTWGSVLALIVLILTCDIPGSTPVLKSQFHDEKFYQVVLDSDKCRGAAFCEDVCPRNCFDVDNENRVALLTGIHRCVRCSACIVQCPFDALTFQSPSGDILSPERIRRQKLSLSGKRSLKRK
jgi:ferredoxin